MIGTALFLIVAFGVVFLVTWQWSTIDDLRTRLDHLEDTLLPKPEMRHKGEE